MATGRSRSNNIQSAVIGTNDDAAGSKLSASNIGYFKDEFVHMFVKRPSRRPPLINRGYASRVLALDLIMKQFLSAGDQNKQIVSLGAGFDTTYWKLKKSGVQIQGYYEVDFPEVVHNKISIITKNKTLSDSIQQLTTNDKELHSSDYHLVSTDLNNVPELEVALIKSGIDFTLPTFFMSECVLIYMHPEKGSDVITWASSKFPTSCFVTYEQIKPSDAFGDMMVKNLEGKGCGLLSIHEYPTMDSQRQRYKTCGWDHVEVLDMNSVYNYFLPKSEVTRIGRLELFDEVEEWNLIQGHYCIVWAFNDKTKSNIWQAAQFESCKANAPEKVPLPNKFIS